MKLAILCAVLCILLLVGCAARMKGLTKSYDKFMKQADRLAAVLCSHSEFSVATGSLLSARILAKCLPRRWKFLRKLS